MCQKIIIYKYNFSLKNTTNIKNIVRIASKHLKRITFLHDKKINL